MLVVEQFARLLEGLEFGAPAQETAREVVARMKAFALEGGAPLTRAELAALAELSSYLAAECAEASELGGAVTDCYVAAARLRQSADALDALRFPR